MRERLMRLEREVDAREACRRIGRLVEDSNLRGWAWLTEPVEPSAMVRHALERSRVVMLSGSNGVLFAGDLFALYAAGRELAAVSQPAVNTAGRRLVEAIEAVESPPAPLTLGTTTFDWSRPVVMGIVNVTPDSFSDGGRFLDPARAVEHGRRLVAEGADILDVGGESTRPRGTAYGEGAQSVTDADEIARVVPVIRGLAAATQVPISIDTRKAAVAKAALEAGATLVNDVSGLLHDPSLARVAQDAGAALCLMHTPADIEALTHENETDDPIGDVLSGLDEAIDRAVQQGFDRTRLMIDPGIGFGKTRAHNLLLIRHTATFAALGMPVLVGASRKASIGWAAAGPGAKAPLDVEARGPASVAAALVAAGQGAHLVRVHDVAETVQALRVAHAIREAPFRVGD